MPGWRSTSSPSAGCRSTRRRSRLPGPSPCPGRRGPPRRPSGATRGREGPPRTARRAAAPPVRGAPGAAAPVPAGPAAGPTAIPRDRGGDGAPVIAEGQTAGSTSWLVPAGAAVLLVLLLVGTPAGIRALQRRRRLSSGSAGALWDELTATALDVGVRLQPSWTPRRAAGELAEVVGRCGDRSRDAADAVSLLGRAEEVACYGPRGA